MFNALRRSTLGLAAALTIACCAGTAIATDLGIDSESEYQAFLRAVRGAEYVRSDFITEQRKPRVLAAIAGLMAFAERNPLATDDQLLAFLTSLDAHLVAFDPADPDLLHKPRLLAALRFAQVETAELAGTDTDIGNRALALLDLRIRDADGSDAIGRRMADFEFVSGSTLVYDPAVLDLLVGALLGVDPSCNDRPGLPSIVETYLVQEGLDPALALPGGRADRQDINAAISPLPGTFAEWDALRQAGYPEGDDTDLRSMTTSAIAGIAAFTDILIGEIGDAQTPEAGLSESVDDVQNDPVYVAQLLAELHADLEATDADRAAAAAATLLMFQNAPANSDAGTFAEYQRGLHAHNLEVNAAAANIRSGLRIASTIGLGVVAIAQDDPITSVSSLLDAGENLFDLVGLVDTGPSDTDLIRVDIAELGAEMNDRFDRIDAQLNLMYDAIVAVLTDVTQNQQLLEELVGQMAELRSQVRRVEARLYGLLEAFFGSLFTNAVDAALDRYDDTGFLLDYQLANTNYIDTASYLENFATVDARLLADPDGELTLDTIDELLGPDAMAGTGEAPYAPRLNQIRELPTELGFPALAAVDVPAIEPWTQAASAYAQLLRENPWSFALSYGSQLADFNDPDSGASRPELWDLIDAGEDITGLLDAIRRTDADGDTIYETLLDLHRQETVRIQAEISAVIDASFPGALRNGSQRVNLWGIATENVQNIAGRVMPDVFPVDLGGIPVQIDRTPGGSTTFNQGFRVFTDAVPAGGNFGPITNWFVVERARLGDSFRFRTELQAPVVSVDPFYLGAALWRVWLGGEDPGSSPFRRVTVYQQYNWNGSFYQWEPFSEPLVPFAYLVRSFQRGPFESSFCRGYGDVRVGEDFCNEYPPGGGCIGNLRVVNQSLLYDTAAATPTIQREFARHRRDLADAVLSQLGPSDGSADTPLSRAADRLDDLETALDAFVTLGMPDALRDSSPLRSALRGVPGTSELGIRGDDVRTLVARIRDRDAEILAGDSAWSDDAFSLHSVETILTDRLDTIESEITEALTRPVEYPGYLAWTLTELRALRDCMTDPGTGEPRRRVAIDDTYAAIAGQTLSVSAAQGLTANDAEADRRTVTADTAFGAGDGGFVAPQGDLLLADDGSFTYTAPPGFSGTDTFTYRAATPIDGLTVVSAPATVVVHVEPADCAADLAEPFGVLDLADIVAFTTAFLSEQTAADIDANGIYDLNDITAFVTAFTAGCP